MHRPPFSGFRFFNIQAFPPLKISPGIHLWIISLLLVAVSSMVYFSQANAQSAEALNRVTILPDRIIAPPQMRGEIVLTDYDVQTSIRDNMATTTITQTFQNNTHATLEARYLFPLPIDANFSSFALTVNGKPLEGKIMEKAEARRTYEEIVRKLIDPGLLEYVDDKTVQVSIAPFFAGETKKIQLSYTQLLTRDGGLYKYSYYLGNQMPGTLHRPGPRPLPMPHPLGGTDQRSHRYLHESKITSAPPTLKPTEVKIQLDLKTAQALKTIYSPTHDPQINRKGDHQAQVNLTVKPTEVLKEKNFVLYFSQDNNAITLNTLNFQRPGEDGYFLMTLRAPETVKSEAIPKDMVIVIDTSGSMGGEKIKQAKAATQYIINHLRPEDRFGVIQFNTDVSSLKNELVPANSANKKAALDYVGSLEASGSTHIEAALQSGFAQLKNHDAKRPAYVIFLTDGEATVGITDTDGLVKVAEKANQYNAKLFSFGVGYDLNALLLNKLSDGHHGSATFVEPNENLELALTGFYKKIESPVLTNLALDFGTLNVKKLYPEKPGDLFAGSEIILMGRYAGNGQGTVTLTGQVNGKTQTHHFPIHWETSTAHSQLPRLWAGRRIAYLLDNIRQHGENDELKNEVITLSKQYGIITPYTSFLAIEQEDYRRRDRAAMPPRPGVGGSYSLAGSVAPMPLSANSAAMRSSSGKGAVQFSKQLGAMKAQSSAAALDAAQEIGSGGAQAVTLKTIGTKTFQHTQDGIWTDTAYDEKTHGKPIPVQFGTDAYFKLLNDKPELVPYFALGEQVIVVLDDKAYQVLPAAQAP